MSTTFACCWCVLWPPWLLFILGQVCEFVTWSLPGLVACGFGAFNSFLAAYCGEKETQHNLYIEKKKKESNKPMQPPKTRTRTRTRRWAQQHRLAGTISNCWKPTTADKSGTSFNFAFSLISWWYQMARVTPFLSEVHKDNDDELQPLRITTTSESFVACFYSCGRFFSAALRSNFTKLLPLCVCVIHSRVASSLHTDCCKIAALTVTL